MMMTLKKNNIDFVFFGTGPIAVYVLEELHQAGINPSLIVTSPDRAQGRGLQEAPSFVAHWAHTYGIKLLKPEKLTPDFISELQLASTELQASVFIVCDYGFILPKTLLEIPPRGTLNMHPSLLPRLRGPSPIRSAILTDEKTTGATIMLLDEKMDHGPIIAQKKITPDEWPPHAAELEALLARTGGRLLGEVLPAWVAGDIEAHEQNHDIATYCTKMEKADGELDLSADPYQNLLKIRAYEGWPGTFAYFQRDDKKIRVKILDAHIFGGQLIIDRVIPEGKKEIPYHEFVRSGATPIA